MSTARPFHHGDLKATLARSAAVLLERSGADALSIREVAREAGVSSAAPYRHYPNRDALLAEVARDGFERLHDALMAVEARQDRRTAFVARSLAYVRFAQSNPALYRLMFGALPGKHRHEGLVEASGRLFALLDEATGDADPRQPFRAVGCWAAIHGLATLALDGQLEAHLPGVTDDHLLAVLQPLADTYVLCLRDAGQDKSRVDFR